MLTISTAFPAPTASPVSKAWSDVASLYRDALGANTQQLVLSSARIIQEHTLRAFMSAAQACADALAKNALSVQQDSMARLLDANGKVAGVMGNAFTQAWVQSMRPAK
ncbi:MAG: hypothetical protein V7631_815 [Massilia sp.]|jgi:hypothetical protein